VTTEDEVGHRVFQLPDTGQTPAMAMDRIIDPDSPTAPMPQVPRPRTTRPLPPDASATPNMPPAAPLPDVSPARRSAGRIIAVALLVLLVLLIVAAVWFIGRRVLPAVDITTTTIPAPRR
jgi:hypothetical protein